MSDVTASHQHLPRGWVARRLGDFTTIVRGSSPRPKGDKRYYGGAIPRLMVEDVTRDGKFVFPHVDYLTDAGAQLSRPMPAGSLTLVCSGTVGVPSFLAVAACIHDGFLGFRQISDCCCPDYLYHQFAFLKQQLDTLATHGGIFTNLTTGIVKDFQIPLPPLPQQRKIARILTTLDNVITQTEALIAKYQAIKQGLMHDLFTRGVDATGKLRPPQSEAPELYKQSELGWIPKEWEAVRLIEIAEVKGGKRLPAGQPFANAPTAFPYIRVSDMRDWTIDDSAIEYVPDHIEPFIRQYKISCDDLYISIAGVYLGLVGMVPTSLDNAQLTENAAKIVLRNKEAHSKEFLTAFFHSTLFFCQLEQVKGIGSGVPKLALHRIEAFMVPIPKRDEQNRIAESLLQIRAVITKECEAVSKAKDEKTGLMQDLLTGKVPVKADEPEEITP